MWFDQKFVWSFFLSQFTDLNDMVYTHSHTYIYTHLYVYIYTHTHLYVYTYIHTHLYVYIHIYTHTDTYMYIHTHTCIYTHTHMYIHTHTHTHTCILSRDGSRRRGGGNDTPHPVELTLSRSQKVTVRRECGSRRCSHLSDLGSPDIGRGKRKWSQMIGGDPKRQWGSLPLSGSKYKKGSFFLATLVADGR